MSKHYLALGSATLMVAALPIFGQVEVRAPFVKDQTPGLRTARPAPLRVVGQVVRTLPDSATVVRTADGRDVVVYYGPRATYRLGNREVMLADVPAGTPVDFQYYVDANRNVLVAPVPGPSAYPTSVLQGRLVLTSSTPPSAIIITDAGEEIRVSVDDSARVTAEVENRNGLNVLRSVNPLTVVAAAPTTTTVKTITTSEIRGRIVGVDKNSFVVRTPEGEDVTIYRDTETTYTINGRPGVWSDIKEGAEVSTRYAVNGARRVARTIVHGIERLLP